MGRLYADATFERVYLTNCNFDTPGVPGSRQGENQLTAANNKAYVCGDNNNANNRNVGRHRGDIQLRVERAWADLPANRPYEITYWDEDEAPAAAYRTQRLHF